MVGVAQLRTLIPPFPSCVTLRSESLKLSEPVFFFFKFFVLFFTSKIVILVPTYWEALGPLSALAMYWLSMVYLVSGGHQGSIGGR